MTVATCRRASRPIAFLVACAIALLSPSVRAEPPSDADLFAAINDAMAREAFEEAARLLEVAYARDPQPTYLYSLGEAWLAADQCPAAVDAFDRYLATNPEKIDADAARSRRATCPEPAPTPAPSVEPRQSEAAPAPEVPAPRPRTVARAPLFWGLSGSGMVFALAGGGVLVGARISADSTNRATTEGAWVSSTAQTRTLATAGTVVLVAGGTLLVAAVIRAVTLRRNARARG